MAITNKRVELVAAGSPQTITGSWANLGNELDIDDFARIALWADIDINSSNDVRFRILYALESGGSLYKGQLYSPSASDTKLEDEYYELNVDADGKIVFDVGAIGASFAQIQVMVGTVGGTAARILSADVTLDPIYT